MNLAATAVTHFYDPLFGKQIIVACMGADSTLRGVNCVGSLVANLSSSIFTYLSIHFHSWLPTFVSVWLSEMRLSRLFFLEAPSARDHCACATGDGDILIKLFFVEWNQVEERENLQRGSHNHLVLGLYLIIMRTFGKNYQLLELEITQYLICS